MVMPVVKCWRISSQCLLLLAGKHRPELKSSSLEESLPHWVQVSLMGNNRMCSSPGLFFHCWAHKLLYTGFINWVFCCAMDEASGGKFLRVVVRTAVSWYFAITCKIHCLATLKVQGNHCSFCRGWSLFASSCIVLYHVSPHFTASSFHLYLHPQADQSFGCRLLSWNLVPQFLFLTCL